MWMPGAIAPFAPPYIRHWLADDEQYIVHSPQWTIREFQGLTFLFILFHTPTTYANVIGDAVNLVLQDLDDSTTVNVF
jgi:hypothetical protein